MKQYSEVFPRSTVFVIGGGIGGLAAALALARAGHTVTLAEQAAEFGEVGAGLQLAPNATRILRDWGLLDAVVHAGVVTENLVARDAIDGSVLTEMPLGEAFLARYDAPYVVIHRTDLHQILLDACRASAGITLLTGTTIIDVQTEAQGATVTAEDGRRATYPVVIGADGLRSRTRDALVGDAPIPSGYVAYRGTIPSDSQASNDVTVWMGPGCHLVQYPLRQGTLLNNVVVFKSAGFARGDVEYGGVDELDTVFAGCAEPVQAALAHVGRQRRWPLYDRAPAPTWNDGRIVLTGDAAHPMLQYLAQGACQALEDADALARLAPGSEASEWDGAIAGFVAEREPRASRVQTTAHAFGDLCHAVGEQRLARNALLASRARDDFTVADWLWADRAPAHL